MRTFGRILMAGCVAGLALTTAGFAAAGGKKANLSVIVGGLPSGHARAATALGALSLAIGENSKGPATRADIAAAQTAIAQARSSVYGLGNEEASDFAAGLEGTIAKRGVPGTTHEQAAGTVTWAQRHGKGLGVRLGLGDGSFGQAEVVISAGAEGNHPVIRIFTGTWKAPPNITGRELAAQPHLEQTLLFAARGPNGSAHVERVPGHRRVDAVRRTH